MMYLSFFNKKSLFFLCFALLLWTCKKSSPQEQNFEKLPEGVDPFEILSIQIRGVDCFRIENGSSEENFIRILFAEETILEEFKKTGLTENHIQLHPGVQFEKLNQNQYRLIYQGQKKDYFLSVRTTSSEHYFLNDNGAIYEENQPDFFRGSLQILNSSKTIQGVLVGNEKKDLIHFLKKTKSDYSHCLRFALEEDILNLQFGTQKMSYTLDLEEVDLSVFDLIQKEDQNLIYSRIFPYQSIDMVVDRLENVAISDYFSPKNSTTRSIFLAPYLHLNYKNAQLSYLVDLKEYKDAFLTPILSPTQPKQIIHADIDQATQKLWVVTSGEFDYKKDLPSFLEFRSGVERDETENSFSLRLGTKIKNYTLLGEKMDENWLVPKIKNFLPEGLTIDIRNDIIFIDSDQSIPLSLDWFDFENGVSAMFNDDKTALIVSFGHFSSQEKIYLIDFSYQAWSISDLKLLNHLGQPISAIFQNVKEPILGQPGEIQLLVGASYFDQIDDVNVVFSTIEDLETQFIKPTNPFLREEFSYQQIGLYKVGIKGGNSKTYKVMIEIWDEKRWIADDFLLYNSVGNLADYISAGSRKVDHEKATITANIHSSGYLTSAYTIKANVLQEGMEGKTENAFYDKDTQIFTADYVLSYDALGLQKTYTITLQKL